MAVPRGFEPLISALTTRRLRPLTDGTVCTSQRRWCRRAESNRRHEDFQSSALPTELPRHIWARRLASYHTLVGETGFEPVTPCL